MLALLLGALGGSQAGSAAQSGLVRLVRVKPADAEIRRLVVDGHLRSEVFRALMAELHQSEHDRHDPVPARAATAGFDRVCRTCRPTDASASCA